MSLIVGRGLARYYGEFEVFKNISFSIEHGDRIGLVGPNGEGKTTLLRLLSGHDEPTSGKLQYKRGLRLGYLPQDPPILEDTTLWQFAQSVFAQLLGMEKELAGLAEQLANTPSAPEVLEHYSALQAEFERRQGYTYETRIRTVLTGLGLGEEFFQMPLAHLSGGQRTRALLARLLLEEPDLLLLDEPTNHLDLEAVEWLEGWAQGFKGSMVVVSHDRYFLDAVTQRTWEMSFGVLETYRGGYSAYLRQRQERYRHRLKQWEAQQEHIEKTEDFIRRFLAGQRTKEAQGRRTRLERFKRHEAIEKPQQPQRIRVRLKAPQRSGDMVLEFRNLSVGYTAGKSLLRVPDMEAERGQRIAVVGPNGAGKTTLVRTILEEIEPLEGAIRRGAKVEIGYLSQDHDYMDEGTSVLDAVRQVSPRTLSAEIRNLLGSFLFSGDDVFKVIGELSGGQRSRVALARLVIQEFNLLVLDEPTNHLDIASQEVLEEVLRHFEGTLLLVSHDRYLIQSLATHIWVVGEGTLHLFEGNWDDYTSWRDDREAVVAAAETQVQGDRRAAHRQVRRERKQAERMQARHEEVEATIHQLEGQLVDLSQRIGKAGEEQDVEKVNVLGVEYREIEKQMEVLWAEWEELAAALED
jgi:ATP-binding cassette subfamily F protein 3